MSLFGSSSKKTSNNTNKSQGGQSSLGDVNNYNAEAGATLTVTDAGAIAAGAKANDNATALAAEALRTNTNVLMATGEYVGNMLANESSENRQFVSEAHETNALLLGEMSKNNAALSGMAINANQQLATDALASNGAALNAMSAFANESLERVSDTNESALTQTNEAFQTSIQQLAANQATSQNQINDLLTNLQTEGESEVQKTSGKQTVWIVGIAGVAVLAVALIARK